MGIDSGFIKSTVINVTGHPIWNFADASGLMLIKEVYGNVKKDIINIRSRIPPRI